MSEHVSVLFIKPEIIKIDVYNMQMHVHLYLIMSVSVLEVSKIVQQFLTKEAGTMSGG